MDSSADKLKVMNSFMLIQVFATPAIIDMMFLQVQ